jgi:hypothetical protein
MSYINRRITPLWMICLIRASPPAVFASPCMSHFSAAEEISLTHAYLSINSAPVQLWKVGPSFYGKFVIRRICPDDAIQWALS